MDQNIARALKQDRVIDITTIGRKTGKPRRIEIWFHNIQGSLYITGRPGKVRDWYLNMVAHPKITFHLKHATKADIPAHIRPIIEEGERRKILSEILKMIGRDVSDTNLDDWIRESPLVEITLETP